MKNKIKNVLDKIKERISNLSLRQFLLTAVLVAVMVVLMVFSEDIIFYETETGVDTYTMELNGEGGNVWENPVRFNYEGSKIVLNISDEIDYDDVKIYAGSRFGNAIVNNENMADMNENFTGNFIAVLKKQKIDIDDDGKEENVYYTAKTDIRSIQTNSSVTPLIGDEDCILEPALINARTLIIYYNGARLKEREVTITFADGSSGVYETDETGCIQDISILNIRQGIQIRYEPNGKNTYICLYTSEGTSLISNAWIPFLMVLALAIICIIICIILQKAGSKEKERKGCSICISSVKSPAEPITAFTIARWITMVVCFILITYGGILIGNWFENITIPVFACGRYNEQQLVGSACYYLSHLDILFSLSTTEIITFCLSFFIPLIFFGRILCGFVCPAGLLQDVLHVIRKKTKTEGFMVEERWHTSLATIKWILTMIFLFICFAGLDFCKFCPLITMSPAFSGFKVSVYVSGFIMVIVLVGSFFKNRFFCNICPLGLIMGLFYKISFFQLKKDCTACTECGACYHACPMGIKDIYTEREKKTVTTHNCIMCGECIRHCPEDQALKITFLGLPVYKSSRDKYMKRFKRKIDKA